MKKSILAFIVLLCLSLGLYVWYKLWEEKQNTYLPVSWKSTWQSTPSFLPSQLPGWLSTWATSTWVSGKPQLPPSASSFPMTPADCDKLSSSERENCLFSVTVRGARNGSDISVCKGLTNQARCEKAITDQFSTKFQIMPR